jgi:hypothetical protein
VGFGDYTPTEPAVEAGNDLAGIGVDVVDIANVTVVDLFVVVVLDLPAAKVQPNRSTLRSPAGLRAA